MIDYRKIIKNEISKSLQNLSWRCQGCPQTKTCESQSNGGEERYCWPIIEAAILGNQNWETDHDPKNNRKVYEFCFSLLDESV